MKKVNVQRGKIIETAAKKTLRNGLLSTFVLSIYVIAVSCQNNTVKYTTPVVAIDISELDDIQLGKCCGDSLYKGNAKVLNKVFRTVDLFEIAVPDVVDSMLRNYVIPEMKANGCAKYKYIKINHKDEYIGFSIVTPDEVRNFCDDLYGYNDDYDYRLIFNNFENNKMRYKKSDKKKTIETIDSRYYFPAPWDPPVCYFKQADDPSEGFELVHPFEYYL